MTTCSCLILSMMGAKLRDPEVLLCTDSDRASNDWGGELSLLEIGEFEAVSLLGSDN